ncbi:MULTISPECIES: proline--tRNA ligase [unclassified Thermoactinomyces]|jgi:prolyl-tRNA synthetase|uniref:proline--tRNA ligase n=1 Tax=unclassified Thermoactinomyces TaxID=2634588 RepID=UPI0018DD292A|nr:MULTISPECIES: proline--tRNA ligase [unclassified Thermoactinomyces]MBH8585266.1 proline--tRNA ligase [Thermoactinomyces sp. CICC 10520]MBI0390706.1 proline--tRNA ligase [Thermoactinomyces sp. CICC 24226]
MSSKKTVSQSEDFSGWYIETIKKADLMDYSPVRGCIVFKPAGYALWEAIQKELDARLKETGHENAYFPLFIPQSFFEKEKEHVEGFNPELPWVTEAGGDPLEEKLAIRPTSETMIGHMFSKWVKSYRDLPLLMNQWCNVVRWEKRTLPFLRTSEFLWQEGHTAHATEQEAKEETFKILDLYAEFIESVLAIPVVRGEKTPSEKFAGAVHTYSVEAMMKDGKALQAGTSHYMGQRFAKSFDIQFTDANNQLAYAYTTSWGVSTRLIGALIMVHGDDQGLVLPPRIAPTQVIIIPIGAKGERERVLSYAAQILDRFKAKGIRVKLDDRDNYSPGWKFNEYEAKGIPLRMEIGPRDVNQDQVVLARRDTLEKITVPAAQVLETVDRLFNEIQENLYQQAKANFDRNTHMAETLEALTEIIQTKRGFVLSGWCGDDRCEAKVKEESGAVSRNIPFDPPETMKTCVACGEKAKYTVWFAKSY